MRYAAVTFSLLLPCLTWGASYYVATNGNDSADGSIGTPWLTVQHALDTVAAGDTAIVTAGDYYGTNRTKVDGTSGNPITLQGQPGAWLRWNNGVDQTYAYGLTVSNSWYVVRGLNFWSNCIVLYDTGATHNTVESNWLERTRAVTFYSSTLPYTNGPSSNTVRFNVFTNMAYVTAAMGVAGSNNRIQTNIWWTSNDNDAIDFFGLSNRFSGNLFVDVGPSAEHSGNHVDIFQSFALGGQECHWCWIENNTISNCNCHFGIWEDVTSGSPNTYGGVSDLFFVNNRCIGGAMDGFVYASRIHFWNNTIYGPAGGIPCFWFRGEDVHGWARDCDAFGNIIAEYNGPTTPIAIDLEATNILLGWNFLSLVGGAVAAPTYSAPGTISGGYAKLVSTNSPYDLRLAAGSPCIGASTNLSTYFTTDANGFTRTVPWDMGAYGYGLSPAHLVIIGKARIGKAIIQ